MGVQTLQAEITKALLFYDNFYVSESAIHNGKNIVTDRILKAIADRDAELVAELEKLKQEEWHTIPTGQTVQDKDLHNFNVGLDAAINLIKERSEG